jgi:hypothetical protein
MSRLKDFFIICSGAEPSILDDPRCLVERSKYAAIGATVLSTAVLASLSGGYAMYTTFQSALKAIGFGIVWGLIIFNLDRYIVSSIKKQRINPDVPRNEQFRIRLREFGSAVPRFLLAILISLVITRPIELKLFDREINAYVEDEKSKKTVAMQQQKEREFPRIGELNVANEALRGQLRAKEVECNDLYEIAMSEATGKSEARTSGREGKGPLFRERWQNSENCRSDLVQLRSQIEQKIAANDAQIKVLEGQRDAAVAANKAKIDAMDGLLMRLKGHSVLTNENASLALASLLIVGLFILLETAPMVVKLLSKRGPYEDICEAQEYEVLKSQQLKMTEVDDETETLLALKRRRDAALLDADLKLRKSVIVSMETNAREKLQNIRREVPTDLVEHWKNAELNNFKARFEPESNNGHKNATTIAS